MFKQDNVAFVYFMKTEVCVKFLWKFHALQMKSAYWIFRKVNMTIFPAHCPSVYKNYHDYLLLSLCWGDAMGSGRVISGTPFCTRERYFKLAEVKKNDENLLMIRWLKIGWGPCLEQGIYLNKVIHIQRPIVLKSIDLKICMWHISKE